MKAAWLVPLVLAVTSLTACGDSVETVPLPDGIVLHLDQSRLERKGREVFVRVQNDTRRLLTIEQLGIASPRLPTVRWSGDERIDASGEADLELDLPHGTCGTALDAEVTVAYRLGDGELRRSTVPVRDRYGNVSLLVDRDCAESTLTEAAALEVGEPSISGEGRDSVLRLPVTLTPTGRADDVAFGGFGSTVLFTQTGDSPTDVDLAIRPGGGPLALTMAVVPARCDPHALAEDKVGTLFDVAVRAPGLPDDAAFYLPLTKIQRSAFFRFFRSHCGLA